MLDQIAHLLNVGNDQIAGWILTMALALAGVGTLAMAILEAAKALLPLRCWFHQWRARDWIGDSPACWEEFMALTTGGYVSRRALFDQPVEKFMAQVQAGANMAMDFPDRYPNFYGLVTRQDAALHAADARRWKAQVEQARGQALAEHISAEEREAAKARARLQNIMARQLDAFQTQTQFMWARANQLASTLIGAVLMSIALWNAPYAWFQILAIAVLGGMTAPFAKDIVSNLSSFRK